MSATEAPPSPPPPKPAVRWGLVALGLGGCGCLLLGIIGAAVLVALPDFLAARRHAQAIPGAAATAAADTAPPLLGPVGDDDGSRGCGCSYSDEKGREWLWSDADEEGLVHLHLKGHDLALKAEGSPTSQDRNFISGATSLRLVERSEGSACPEAGESCESEKMRATLEAQDGPQKQVVTLTGECGC